MRESDRLIDRDGIDLACELSDRLATVFPSMNQDGSVLRATAAILGECSRGLVGVGQRAGFWRAVESASNPN